MSFTDADEFFTLRNASIPDMPSLLRQYEQYGALVVNWQVCMRALPGTWDVVHVREIEIERGREIRRSGGAGL